MRNPSICVSSALIIVCLTGGIQGISFVGSLATADGARIAEQDGRLVLIPGRNENLPKLEGSALERDWRIGAPYLQSGKKFLALDQSEAGVKVYLSEEKGDSTKWVIEVLKTVQPQTAKSSPRLVEGTSGSKFRLIIFDGRYKGWYLAAKDPTETQVKTPANVPMVQDFQVVQDPKQALTFNYVDSFYRVQGK